MAFFPLDCVPEGLPSKKNLIYDLET
jgi:hypothetical protein